MIVERAGKMGFDENDTIAMVKRMVDGRARSDPSGPGPAAAGKNERIVN